MKKNITSGGYIELLMKSFYEKLLAGEGTATSVATVMQIKITQKSKRWRHRKTPHTTGGAFKLFVRVIVPEVFVRYRDCALRLPLL